MGMFGDFIKAFKEGYNGTPSTQAATPTSQSAVTRTAPWGYQLRGVVNIGGDYENTIYTYDSRPLKGVRKGQTITVETYCGDCTMESIHTGMTWDSLELGDVPVMYNDQIIGFTTVPRSQVIKAAQLGYALRFKAKCYGMLEGYKGVKEMKMLAPRPFDVAEWLP